MNAKEMFEELGYKYVQNNINNVIKYKIKHFISDTNYIMFDLDTKQINCYILSDSPFTPSSDMAISVKELQAINKQIEELGWNDED